MKFLFFGTGKIANDIMSNIIMPNSQIEIVGFCDNDISKQNQSFGDLTFIVFRMH